MIKRHFHLAAHILGLALVVLIPKGGISQESLDSLLSTIEKNEEIINECYRGVRGLKNKSSKKIEGKCEDNASRKLRCNCLIDDYIKNLDAFANTKYNKNPVGNSAISIFNSDVKQGIKTVADTAVLELHAIKIDALLFTSLNNGRLSSAINEYNTSIASFGRRMSKFIKSFASTCANKGVVPEKRQDRIDMAIAAIQSRKNEIMQICLERNILLEMNKAKEGTYFMIDSTTIAIQDSLQVIRNDIIDLLQNEPTIEPIKNVFAFHAGIPNHYGGSFSTFIKNNEIQSNRYQLGLTGIVLLDLDSTSVLVGGQAGIMSQHFGARLGMIFNLDKHNNGYGPMISLLFRDQRFIFGVEASDFHYGISIGHTFK